MKWVLVHVEIQSQEDAGFPLRMFQYRYRALDLFCERSLACLAILGDTNTGWRPQGYSFSFWGTEIEFKFRTEGQRETLMTQIAVKFGPLTDEVIAAINGWTAARLDRLSKDILTANTLDQLGLVP